MDEKKNFWPVLAQVIRAAVGYLGLYLDDLLLIAAGVCLTAAAYEQYGKPAGFAAAGVCLAAYAFIIARSRGGGKS
ncbi:hypothetical protein [Flavonifractor sp. An91]|uniref:hypothetical protein n=1 Tax=Flavonifractor sp. An91 TaxID=1965665 RepID=UPI000B3A25BB|nr:hypothetical protein [Flavonifractor sp. An91]OUN10224.1 hypothetical protein B5G42_10865 [Flavonifractor sp. An91]